MRSVRRGRAFAAIALVTALGVAGCSSSSSTGAEGGESTRTGGPTNEYGGQVQEEGKPAQGGTFTFAMASGAEHIDPRQPIGASLVTPMRAVYDALMVTDADGKAVPHLVESMESDDNKTWTMKLPAGLKFTDGTPFDAKAVVAHVKQVAAEDSSSQQAGQARKIKKMETPDATTIVFTLDEPWTDFPTAFADASSLAFVPSPTAVKKQGAQYGLHPVGAGPFMVEQIKPGDSIRLKRNPDYRVEGQPYVDELDMVVLPESSARISGLRSGDIDAAAMRTPADVKSAGEAGLTVLDQPGYNYYTIYLNMKDPALGDPRVRQAMSMAINREGVNATVFNGQNEEVAGFLSPTHPLFSEAEDWPAFDEAEAKKLVDEVEGEGSQIKLAMTLPPIPEMSRIAAVVQQMLEKVGIEMDYKTVAPTTMVADSLSGNWQLQMRDSGVMPETLIRLTANFDSSSPYNVVGEANQELDALFAKATAAEGDERADLIDQIQDELAAWMPQVPLVTSTSAMAIGKDVTHFPGNYPTTSSETFDPALVAVKQ